MKEQLDELKTIRERTIKLRLSDADVQRISERAGSVGLTVSQILENFIGDLVYGTHDNGSDERMYANQWFERCWFGMFPENTFLRYLIVSGLTEEFFEALEVKEESAAEIEISREELENENYEWDVLMFSAEAPDGIKAYATREEWELQEQKHIAFFQEELQEALSTIDEMWNEFLSRTNKSKSELTMEEEMEKVIKWHDGMKQFLE